MVLKEGTGSNKPILLDSVGRGRRAAPVWRAGVHHQPAHGRRCLRLRRQPGGAVVRQDTTIAVDSSRLFNSDQSEVRAIMRADLAVPNPLAVVHITGLVAAMA